MKKIFLLFTLFVFFAPHICNVAMADDIFINIQAIKDVLLECKNDSSPVWCTKEKVNAIVKEVEEDYIPGKGLSIFTGKSVCRAAEIDDENCLKFFTLVVQRHNLLLGVPNHINYQEDGISGWYRDNNGKCARRADGLGVSTKNTSLCDELSNNGWIVVFSYGNVVGEARCRNNSVRKGCDCKITKPNTSSWIAYESYMIDIEEPDGLKYDLDCNEKCASECSHAFRSNKQFRKTLFGIK